MSATNRGSQRIEQDFYPTPLKSFLPLLPYINQIPHKGSNTIKVWEPACGDRRLIDLMNECNISSDGNDLENGYDFLKDENWHNCIITNPPFSLAQEFISHALNHSNEVFMLLRIGFLASEKRKKFWEDNKPNALFILSKRPNFVISVKCNNLQLDHPGYHEDERNSPCGYNKIFQFEEKKDIPKKCPECGGKLSRGSSDSSEYAWFYWGRTHQGLYWL